MEEYLPHQTLGKTQMLPMLLVTHAILIPLIILIRLCHNRGKDDMVCLCWGGQFGFAKKGETSENNY